MILEVSKTHNLLFIFLLFIITSCDDVSSDKPADYSRISGYAQGTTFSIVYQDNSDYSDSIDAILTSFDKQLSTYDSLSFVSIVNNGPDSCYQLKNHDWFYTCFHYAEFFYNETNNCFNPSIYPLVNYWGFYHENEPTIDSSYIRDSLLPLLKLEDNFSLIDSVDQYFMCKHHPNAKLDFNAIAQGYSVDIIAEFLEEQDVQNFMVEIGGEVRSKGVNHKGEYWKIGIERPVDSSYIGEHGFQKIVSLNNQALATSGNYRKFKTYNGSRISHAINPVTGFPTTNSLLSVSVTTDKAATADALATSFLVMGKQNTISYLKEIEKANFKVYMIYDSLGEYEEWSNF
tara:strand:- start:10 stop:1041 length:1032 start_codon:yes stop_codon:yes gene_type:complete